MPPKKHSSAIRVDTGVNNNNNNRGNDEEVKSYDAIFMCEQSVNAVGPKYTHDHEYYRRLQNTLNLTNEDMYNYLQQWMCVMPPENYDEYISDTLLKYAELVQDSELLDDFNFRGGLDNLDLEAILQQKGIADSDFIDENIINSVYQEVESEPLNL